jgi:hypothetical protein
LNLVNPKVRNVWQPSCGGDLVKSRTLGAILLAVLAGLLLRQPVLSQTAVTTYHNNQQRTGWNSTETTLSPAAVASSFGWIATVRLDDQVDTQPLVVPNVTIQGAGVHTVVYVTTEGNTIYAIDAVTGAILRSRNLGAPVPKPLNCENNGPNVGINGTATIDSASSTLYVLVYSRGSAGPVYNLHALDLATLGDRPGSPALVQATQSLQPGGTYAFNATVQRQRPGLLDANGKIYAGFGSFCDFAASQSRGWLLSWNKSSLALQSGRELTDRLATSDASDCTYTGNHPCFLASVWMSGYGLSTDSSGNVYFTTGNSAQGTYNGVNNLAESALKMSGDLTSVLSFFTPSDESTLDQNDTDYGSGGLMVLPDQPGAFPHVAVAGGKDGRLFVLNRDSLGGSHSPDVPNSVPIGACWCGPSYFESPSGPLVISSGGNQVKAWSLGASGGKPSLSLAASAPPIEATSQDPGFFTSVSSNGTAPGSAVIWAVGRAAGGDNHLTLYAYNATPSGGTLPLLWSSIAGSWPNTGGNANVVPTVANGHVYVASNQQLEIFGIRPPNDVSIWRSTGTPCSGNSCPGWQRLDDNTKTAAIASDGTLYQLHNDGMIWRSTGVACSGNSCPGWQLLDDNTKSVAIAPGGGNLYQLHNDGMIWRFMGTPCSGTSCPSWQLLDNNSLAAAITAASNLYQLHIDGTIWRFTGIRCRGASCPGWQLLDDNNKSVAIVADGGDVYQLHNDGKIWRYTGTPCSGNSCPGWQMLDDNTKSAAIVAGGGNLYQLHNDGMIWKFTGTPCTGSSCPGWQLLDNNTKSVRLVADGGSLYQLHNDGKIWRYTGTPCSGNSCPGWQMLDDNIQTTRMVSGGGQLDQLHGNLLYQLHSDGSIWRYTGAVIKNNSCPGLQ